MAADVFEGFEGFEKFQKYEELGHHGDWDPTGVLVIWSHWSGDYEWEQYALLRRQVNGVNQWNAYIDSGCSCSGPFEDKPDDSWEWSYSLLDTKAKLIKAMRDSYFMSSGEAVDEIAGLQHFVRTLSL